MSRINPIGKSIFILIQCPKIENNYSMNIRITATIPKIEITLGISFNKYNV